jgi:hypothetical protein
MYLCFYVILIKYHLFSCTGLTGWFYNGNGWTLHVCCRYVCRDSRYMYTYMCVCIYMYVLRNSEMTLLKSSGVTVPVYIRVNDSNNATTLLQSHFESYTVLLQIVLYIIVTYI